MEERLPVGSTVLLRTSLDKKGKFGRILIEIHLAKGPGEEGFQEKTLNEVLLDETSASGTAVSPKKTSSTST